MEEKTLVKDLKVGDYVFFQYGDMNNTYKVKRIDKETLQVKESFRSNSYILVKLDFELNQLKEYDQDFDFDRSLGDLTLEELIYVCSLDIDNEKYNFMKVFY